MSEEVETNGGDYKMEVYTDSITMNGITDKRTEDRNGNA